MLLNSVQSLKLQRRHYVPVGFNHTHLIVLTISIITAGQLKADYRCRYSLSVLSVCLWLRLNVPVNNFSVMSGRSHHFLVINQYFRGVKCLAQGHNTAAVDFEPLTSRSGVRHSTTEPPRSPVLSVISYQNSE